MNTLDLTREQVLQTITTAILEGNTTKARQVMKEASEYSEMTGRFLLHSITLKDLNEAITEKEIIQ